MPIIASPFALFQHSTTTKKLVKAALRKIGALGVGEEVEAAEFVDAIDELNRMLDSWNTERLTVNVLGKTEWTLSAATENVEVGPGGSLDQVRPNRMEQGEAFIRQTGTTTEYELTVWSRERWAQISEKAETGRPRILYYEPSFPLGVIHLWPVTDQQYDLILYTWNLLSQVSNVEQALALPPAYSDAIVNELAARLAPEYGKQTPPEIAIAASQSKANLKRINQPSADARVDEAALGDARGTRFDINTGGF